MLFKNTSNEKLGTVSEKSWSKIKIKFLEKTENVIKISYF